MAWISVAMFYSCKSNIAHVYSPDRSKCITLISEGNYRYVINGETESVPEEGFVKLDLSNVPVDGDQLGGCWSTGSAGSEGWVLYCDFSEIVESKIDTSRFIVKTSFPTRDDGIPTSEPFSKEHCFDFGYDNGIITFARGDVIVD